MFDKLKNIGYMAKHSRQMFKIEKVYKFVMENTAKRCLYCDLDLGDAMDLPVIDFLNHMKDNHSDKIDSNEIDKMIKIFT